MNTTYPEATSQLKEETMKTTSKTVTTLERLRIRRDSIGAPENTSRHDITSNSPRNVVGFHPDELDAYKPLKPEEADEGILAELFRDHDFSFLFEASSDENGRLINNRKRKLPPSYKHRIPSDEQHNSAEKCATVGKKEGPAISAIIFPQPNHNLCHPGVRTF
jgi:hypothetical protein